MQSKDHHICHLQACTKHFPQMRDASQQEEEEEHADSIGKS